MPKPTFRKKAKDDDSSIAKFSNEKISVGDIRKTQMITTFGFRVLKNSQFYTRMHGKTSKVMMRP